MIFGRSGRSGRKAKTFAGQKRRRGLLNHRLLLAAGLASVTGLLLLGQFGDSGIASWWKLKAEEDNLAGQVTDLEESNRELEIKLESLANDPVALEKLAREEHNMRHQDEEVLTVLDRSNPEKIPPP